MASSSQTARLAEVMCHCQNLENITVYQSINRGLQKQDVWFPIVGWMTIPHIPSFDHGTQLSF